MIFLLIACIANAEQVGGSGCMII